MVLGSKRICSFNKSFRPFQRKFAIEGGVVHPSLTLWLERVLLIFSYYFVQPLYQPPYHKEYHNSMSGRRLSFSKQVKESEREREKRKIRFKSENKEITRKRKSDGKRGRK